MFSAGGGWRMCKLLGERQRRRLGLSGECAVAEELNKLIAKDCRVFHDLADEKIGNIDHIVVGPTGVYAIETKTRSKVPSLSRQPDHEVSYDGKALTFPRYTDSDSLEQTRRNAQWLQTFLSSAVGETVEVQPVLALPGWFFSSGVRTSLKVLNPKMIPGLVASNPSVLSPRMIQQVTHQLEQKCRNVDF